MNAGIVRSVGPERPAAAATTAAGRADSRTPVTPEEREYFAQLFPASSAEIRSYPTYSPSGLRKGPATSGTIIDRKG